MSKNIKKPRASTKPPNSIPPFLHKIYEILENDSFVELVSWNEDGNAFIINNVTEFTEKVLPKYFKHNNFASFVRQLNLYDFHKSRYDNNGNEFYHKCFKRGEKNLLAEIKRKMPNEVSQGSPSQFLQAAEDLEAERMIPGLFQGQPGLQDLINRQDRLENAVKMLSTQNKQLIKENKMLFTDIANLKTKQSNTEKATRLINGQNNQLLKENRCLWGDLVMNREKYEKQVEKLFIFLISVLRCQGNNHHNMYKKKNFRGATLNVNTDETQQFDEAQDPQTENNSFSVLPMKKISKFLSNKKAQSQLDKLLDCLEREGIQNLFPKKSLLLDEKELSVQLSSLLERDLADGSFSFLSDKRPPPFDHSIESENPRETASKVCKIEGSGNFDSTVAIITEETNLFDKLQHSRASLPEVLPANRPANMPANNKVVDISSPLPMEMIGGDFEISPLRLKYIAGSSGEDDFHIPETLFGHLNIHSNPLNHMEEEEEEEDEGEDGNDEHKNIRKDFNPVNWLKSLRISRSASQHDSQSNRLESGRSEEIANWLNPYDMNKESNGGLKGYLTQGSGPGSSLMFDPNASF